MGINVAPANRRWREQNGVIYFSVESDRATGTEWIERFKRRGLELKGYVRDVLRSRDFRHASSEVTNVVVFRRDFFQYNEEHLQEIRALASERKLIAPNAEVACLIREQFSDEEIEEMGLAFVIVMHEPFVDFLGRPNILTVGSRFSTHDSRLLEAGDYEQKDLLGVQCGFAFQFPR